MSITVRLWTKCELEGLQHNRWLATVFMNRSSFGEKEMRYYPYNLRKTYMATWVGGGVSETIYATDDTMLLRFIDEEYTRRPNLLTEVITRYRQIIG